MLARQLIACVGAYHTSCIGRAFRSGSGVGSVIKKEDVVRSGEPDPADAEARARPEDHGALGGERDARGRRRALHRYARSPTQLSRPGRALPRLHPLLSSRASPVLLPRAFDV